MVMGKESLRFLFIYFYQRARDGGQLSHTGPRTRDDFDLDCVPLSAAQRAFRSRLIRVVNPAINAIQMKCMVAGPECAAQTFVIVWPRVALIVDRRRTEFVAADRTHLNALPLPEAHGVPFRDLERCRRRAAFALSLFPLRHASARSCCCARQCGMLTRPTPRTPAGK